MQLKELEAHGFIVKKIYPQVPPKVEYRLTTLGESLIPVIHTLGVWADDHQAQLRLVIMKKEGIV